MAFGVMPRQIVINKCYGGYNLSEQVISLYRASTPHIPKTDSWFANYDIRRDDPELIRIITEVGLKVSGGSFSNLKIIEIPDDIPEDGWEIQEYDGIEWVAEKHRTWG
jgi:hypothetical protein